jgi:hypothetical protein
MHCVGIIGGVGVGVDSATCACKYGTIIDVTIAIKIRPRRVFI